MATATVEVWICIDCAGDYATGHDADAAREAYANNIGALEDCDGFRLVKLAVTAPLPEVIELAVDAPTDEPKAKAEAS